jgi:ribosome biogenesis GTPase
VSSGGRRGRELDEDDVRVRPSRGSRPRTKERPAHEDARRGFVVAVDRGRYTCHLGEMTEPLADDDPPITAMKARDLGRRSVVVGDRVAIVGDVSGQTDTLARIVRVEPRTGTLRRTADDNDPFERIIVANAHQLVIVAALADPEPRPRLIDRCLVAAFDAGLTPLLCLTKSDLKGPAELLETYRALAVPYVVTQRGGPLDAVRAQLQDKVSVLVGPSGVGKSTLVNALVPGAARATGGVNLVTGRGRHVSSSAVALPLVGGGWVIDTPGIRSFGVAHVDLDRVIRAFPELEPGTAGCPRSCTHDEPDCALDEWVATGHADPDRLASFRRLLHSRDAEEPD